MSTGSSGEGREEVLAVESGGCEGVLSWVIVEESGEEVWIPLYEEPDSR